MPEDTSSPLSGFSRVLYGRRLSQQRETIEAYENYVRYLDQRSSQLWSQGAQYQHTLPEEGQAPAIDSHSQNDRGALTEELTTSARPRHTITYTLDNDRLQADRSISDIVGYRPMYPSPTDTITTPTKETVMNKTFTIGLPEEIVNYTQTAGLRELTDFFNSVFIRRELCMDGSYNVILHPEVDILCRTITVNVRGALTSDIEKIESRLPYCEQVIHFIVKNLYKYPTGIFVDFTDKTTPYKPDIPLLKMNELLAKEFSGKRYAFCVSTGRFLCNADFRSSLRIYDLKSKYLCFDAAPDLEYINGIEQEGFFIKRGDPRYEIAKVSSRDLYLKSELLKLHPSFTYFEFEDIYCKPDSDRCGMFNGQMRLLGSSCGLRKTKAGNVIPEHSPDYGCGADGYSWTECSARGLRIRELPSNFIHALYPYSTKAERIFGFIPNKGRSTKEPARNKRYFGFEIELEAPTSSAISSRKIITDEAKFIEMGVIPSSDGSLSHGIEFKTAPMEAKKAEECLEKFYSHISDFGFINATTAGFHIHVSRSSLSELQIARILTFVYNRANSDLIVKVAGRESNRYAELTSSKGMMVTSKKAKLKKGTYIGSDKRVYTENDSRYTAVNLTRNTIEFRLFACANTKEKALRYFEFVKALLEYTSAGNICSTKNQLVKETEFVKWLSKVENRNAYPVLTSFLGINKRSHNKKEKVKCA